MTAFSKLKLSWLLRAASRGTLVKPCSVLRHMQSWPCANIVVYNALSVSTAISGVGTWCSWA